MAAALLFGALLSGTSQRNLDPSVFEPELAANLTYIIQGLVVLVVSADVLVLGALRRGRGVFTRKRRTTPCRRGGPGMSAATVAASRSGVDAGPARLVRGRDAARSPGSLRSRRC